MRAKPDHLARWVRRRFVSRLIALARGPAQRAPAGWHAAPVVIPAHRDPEQGVVAVLARPCPDVGGDLFVAVPACAVLLCALAIGRIEDDPGETVPLRHRRSDHARPITAAGTHPA